MRLLPLVLAACHDPGDGRRAGHDLGFQRWIDTGADSSTREEPGRDTGAAADTAPDDEPEPEPCVDPDASPLGEPLGCLTATYVRDDDGDCTAEHKTTLSYDSVGRLVSAEEEGESAWVTASVMRWTYLSEHAQPSRMELDLERDGTMDEVRSWTFDEANRPATEEWDSDGDGTADSIQRWAYAGDGQVVSDELDTDADGLVDFGRWSTYDAAGRIVEDLRFEDGYHHLLTSTYDASGNLLRIDSDDGGDGSPSHRREFSYDADDRLLSATYDADVDGTPEQADYWTYDDGYRVTRLETAEGRDPYERTTTHDEAGRVTRIDYDEGADGAIDRSDVWTYDAGGLLVRFDYVYEGYFGDVEAWDTWTYDAEGRVLSRTSEGHDGLMGTDDRYAFVYDGDGRLESMSYDEWLDGADRIVHYEWDAEGRPLSERERVGGARVLLWSYIDDC